MRTSLSKINDIARMAPSTARNQPPTTANVPPKRSSQNLGAAEGADQTFLKGGTHYCGLGDSLTYEGRVEEAMGQFQTAIDLSPHDPFRWAYMPYSALAHLFGGAFEEAAAWARRATQVPNAHFWATANLVSALGHLGDRCQADEAVTELLRMRPDFTRRFAADRLFYVKDPKQREIFLEGLKRAGIR